MTETAHPVVTAVCRDGQHRFTKPVADGITLLEGLGVEGDAHAGVTVQHRSRVAADPTQPNLRQVHLIHAELHDELRAQGFAVEAGQLGENVTRPARRAGQAGRQHPRRPARGTTPPARSGLTGEGGEAGPDLPAPSQGSDPG